MRMSDFLGGLVVLVVAILPLYFIAAPKPQAATIAVLLTTGWSDEASLAAIEHSGSLPVRHGRYGNIWVVQAADPQVRAALAAAGAWLFLDPVVLEGCGFI